MVTGGHKESACKRFWGLLVMVASLLGSRLRVLAQWALLFGKVILFWICSLSGLVVVLAVVLGGVVLFRIGCLLGIVAELCTLCGVVAVFCICLLSWWLAELVLLLCLSAVVLLWAIGVGLDRLAAKLGLLSGDDETDIEIVEPHPFPLGVLFLGVTGVVLSMARIAESKNIAASERDLGLLWWGTFLASAGIGAFALLQIVARGNPRASEWLRRAFDQLAKPAVFVGTMLWAIGSMFDVLRTLLEGQDRRGDAMVILEAAWLGLVLIALMTKGPRWAILLTIMVLVALGGVKIWISQNLYDGLGLLVFGLAIWLVLAGLPRIIDFVCSKLKRGAAGPGG